MKRKKKPIKKQPRKIPTSKTINIEIFPVDRMQAISNLSLALLETAKALNVPSVVVRDSQFIGSSPAINIIQGRKK